jgi:hypothetical protein
MISYAVVLGVMSVWLVSLGGLLLCRRTTPSSPTTGLLTAVMPAVTYTLQDCCRWAGRTGAGVAVAVRRRRCYLGGGSTGMDMSRVGSSLLINQHNDNMCSMIRCQSLFQVWTQFCVMTFS